MRAYRSYIRGQNLLAAARDNPTVIIEFDKVNSLVILLIQAFTKLMTDENFLNLLRAEGLATMPQFLSDKITPNLPHAA